ncbi:cold-shock protein [Mesorhizobium carmichaelinearum]|uniref:cold-shock protein n=1 Tax=Mesorhizobium carmichaelinearum TaxID=1208188 RepID=UPI001FCEAE65|nr:cold shock protein [Mesorhizobium carmichaelinearum]
MEIILTQGSTIFVQVETIMSKHRDHREPRRRRYDDDPVSFPERAVEPSYFQRSPAATTEALDAEVIWFNASKGFGFVKVSDGTEVYLHIRVLEAAGSRGVSEGTRLKVRIEEGLRGRQVGQVLEIGEDTANAPPSARPVGGAVAGSGAQGETEGTVRWYNPEKGFGFISPAGGEGCVRSCHRADPFRDCRAGGRAEGVC